MATNTYAMTGSGGFQGGGPSSRVNPVNDAFGGGSLTRAGNPVAVGIQLDRPKIEFASASLTLVTPSF